MPLYALVAYFKENTVITFSDWKYSYNLMSEVINLNCIKHSYKFRVEFVFVILDYNLGKISNMILKFREIGISIIRYKS